MCVWVAGNNDCQPQFPVEPVTQRESSRESRVEPKNCDLQISALVESSCPLVLMPTPTFTCKKAHKHHLPWEGFQECPQRKEFIGAAPVSLAIFVRVPPGQRFYLRCPSAFLWLLGFARYGNPQLLGVPARSRRFRIAFRTMCATQAIY